MCLGIPGRVVEIVDGFAGQLALVDVEGARRRVNIGMLDEPPAPGDWVLLHMGFAVEAIDEAKAREALSGLEMMGQARPPRIRRRFEVRGVVQGVGFRPFVYALAADLALAGTVANTSAGVTAEVEGEPDAVADFGRRLRADAPASAAVESVEEAERPLLGGTGFTIDASTGGGRARTLVSPDTATCRECLAELADPDDRRYRHPFITCTHCGPRFTIVTGTPYDRAATTMAAFPMCDDCRAEYDDPADRRFHAQPIACHACGPRLELLGKDAEGAAVPLAEGDDALRGARELLAAGRIVAVKGLGGYHLACDARNERAVAELRRRKARGGKPFAVMVADLGTAAALVGMTADEEELLTGIRRPIVLLPRREPARGAGMAEALPVEGMAGTVPVEAVAEAVALAGVAGLVSVEAVAEAVPLTGVAEAVAPAAGGPPGAARLAGRAVAPGAGVFEAEPVAAVAEAVAPGSPDLGLMLPYSPLHVLLFGIGDDAAGPDALVMTSANLAGEPIVTDDARALAVLAPLADAWLRHDREIQVPCDDSVSRFAAGAELPVRRSRGYAPLPLALPFDVPPTLAVGADLKNTCALAEGRYAWVSQHIGDMDDLSTVEALARTEAHLEHITGVEPKQLVADQHPGYGSGRWAHAHADGRPVHTVQHHHAHIASVMGEHGLGQGESVIGVAFDGTGYGTDGAVWGGEVLVAGYKSFRRAAHLGYVPLAGGDASVLRPYRMALAHLRAAGLAWDEALPAVRACPLREREVLAHQLATGFGCVPTSSMGRLFDAVASLTGVRHEVGYEAEAAVALEALARSAGTASIGPGNAYAFDIGLCQTGAPVVADPGPVIRAVVADVRAGVPAEMVAARFHAAVAALVVGLAEVCRVRTGLGVVALGGGVFQNAVLLEAASQALSIRGFTVLRPRLLPPNDGGIAFGQLLIAASG